MNTISMSSKNSKTSDPHRLLLNLFNKTKSNRNNKTKFQHLIYMKKYKKSQKNNKFKIRASTRNEEFELLGGSYSVSDIQNHFEYILKKTWRRD